MTGNSEKVGKTAFCEFCPIFASSQLNATISAMYPDKRLARTPHQPHYHTPPRHRTNKWPSTPTKCALWALAPEGTGWTYVHT